MCVWKNLVNRVCVGKPLTVFFANKTDVLSPLMRNKQITLKRLKKTVVFLLLTCRFERICSQNILVLVLLMQATHCDQAALTSFQLTLMQYLKGSNPFRIDPTHQLLLSFHCSIRRRRIPESGSDRYLGVQSRKCIGMLLWRLE